MEIAYIPVRRRDRYRGCGSQSWLMFNPATLAARISSNHCWDSLCPRCSRIRQIRLRERLGPFLRTAGDLRGIRHIVLTLRTSDQPIRAEVARLRAAFRRLRQHTAWADHVDGGAAFIEVTFNQSGGGWHPHLHIIADGKYFPHRQLSDAWLKATGDSYIVNIRHVPADVPRLASYVSKYASKGCDTLRIPAERLAEWISDGPRGRLWTLFGTWYRALPTQSTNADFWSGWHRVDDLEAIWVAARDGHIGSIWLLDLAGVDTTSADLAPIPDDWLPYPLEDQLGLSLYGRTLPEHATT